MHSTPLRSTSGRAPADDALINAAIAASVASQPSSRTPSALTSHPVRPYSTHLEQSRLDSAMDETNRQLAVSVNALTDENASLRGRAADATLRLHDADRERAALVYRLQDQAERFREREATYLTELDGLRSERAELLTSMDALRDNANRNRNESSTKETEVNAALVDRERLRAALRAAEGQLQTAEQLAQQRAKELALASVAKVKLERQLGRAQSEAAGATAAAAKEVKVAQDRAQEASAKAMQATDALRLTREELSHAQARLQSREHQASVLADSNAALKKEAVERETLVHTLQLTVQEQEAKLMQLEQLRDERLKSVLDETAQQIDTIRKMMSDRASTYNESLSDKQAMLDALQADVAALRRQTGDAERASELAVSDKRKAQEAVYVAEQQNKLLQETLDHRVAELGRVRDKLSETESDLRASSLKLEQFQRQVGERDARITALESQLQEARFKVAQTEAAKETTDAESSRHARLLAQRDSIIAELEDKCNTLDQKLKAAALRVDAAESKAGELERDHGRAVAGAREAAWEAERERTLLETRIRALEEDARCTSLSHDAEIAKIRATTEAAIASEQEAHRSRTRALEAQLTASAAENQAVRRHLSLEGARASDETTASLEEGHRRRVADIESAHNSVVNELKANHERDLTALRRKLEESHERHQTLSAAAEAANARVDELMILLQRTEEARITDVVSEREHHRSRDLSVALQIREAEDRANRAQLDAAERVREIETQCRDQIVELQLRHAEEAKIWKRADHERQLNNLVSADDRERRHAEALRLLAQMEVHFESCVAKNAHTVLSLESQLRAATTLLEQRERDVLYLARNVGVAQRAASGGRDLGFLAESLLTDAQARGRESIESLCVISGEALRIMAAYHALRAEHDTLRERLAAVLDANDELKDHCARVASKHASELDSLASELRIAHNQMQQQQRELQDLQQQLRAAQQQLQNQRSRPVTPPPPPPPPVVVAQVDETVLRDATEICLLARDAQRVAHGAFQGLPWQQAIARDLIGDELGSDLCNVVEVVQWTSEKAEAFLARHAGSAHVDGTQYQPPASNVSGVAANDAMSPSRRAAMSLLGLSPRTAHRSIAVAAAQPPPPPPSYRHEMVVAAVPVHRAMSMPADPMHGALPPPPQQQRFSSTLPPSRMEDDHRRAAGGWGLRSPPRHRDPVLVEPVLGVTPPMPYHAFGSPRDDGKYTSPLPPPRGLSGPRTDISNVRYH